MKTSRFRYVMTIVLATIGVLAIGPACHFISAAYAASSAPAEQGGDPTGAAAAWTAAAIAAGALLTMVITLVYMVLKVVAPLTKTKIDDEFRDGLKELLTHARTQAAAAAATVVLAPAVAPATVVVAAQPADPGRAPQTGSVTLVLATMLFGVATVIVLLLGSCAGGTSSARDRGAAGASTGLHCEEQNLVTAAAQLVPAFVAAVGAAISGDGKIVDRARLAAIAKPLLDDGPRCALVAAIAAIAKPAAPAPGAPAAAPLEIDGSALLATFASVRGELGWGEVHLADGSVMP